MATAVAASGAECSEPPVPFECTFVDPTRNATLKIAIDLGSGGEVTLGELLARYRASDCAPTATAGGDGLSSDLERRRFADSLFLLSDEGTLGDVIPGLRFRIGGRHCDLDHRLEGDRVQIEVDRSQTGYTRNWPAYLTRRWALRADVYSRFMESLVERACGAEAASILRLDTPERVRRFLAVVAARIYASPYETYSRYLAPNPPFKSVDQTLDRILEGDGGNCAEKAMALYFIARSYGIEAEVVLGGEEAGGKFPFRALRSILDDRAFASESMRDAQRYWQHYAILCRPSENPREEVFCEVAGSNIPFLFLDADAASTYLDPERKTPIEVAITLETIRVYYCRLARRQDLPLDLYYAMEHFIESIDVIHTFDNELGLVHTGDYWVGAIAYVGRRERARIVREYERFVARAGLAPRAALHFARDLSSARHPLFEQFRAVYPHPAGRIIEANSGIRRRIESVSPGSQIEYVIIGLRKETNRSE